MLRFIVLLVLFAQPAFPGAWPREDGTTFATASLRLGWPQQVLQRLSSGAPADPDPTSQYMTLYLEHGLTEKVTIGADIGHAVSGDGKTIAFLRYPVPLAVGTNHKFAVELGLGRIAQQNVIRPGASYGLGFETRRLSGWIAVDGLAELYPATSETDYKLDVTFGLNLSNGRRAILQLQSGQQSGDDPFARLAPSYVFPISENRHVEIGGAVSLSGEADIGVLFGLWQSF